MRSSTQSMKTLSQDELKTLLPPPRKSGAHKKSFGKIQIVAGSQTYPGAAKLCALGAFKAGCGYVVLQTSAPTDLLKDLPEIIPGFHNDADAYVIGPGTNLESLKLLLPQGLENISNETPLLLDAGALGDIDYFISAHHGNFLVTPHEGELSKILGPKWTADQIRSDRENAGHAFLQKYPHAFLLLKGSPTTIFSKSESWIMDFGTVAMATAGQGDLLSGVIGAYLALGLPIVQAALLGSALCALAAAKISKNREPQGVLAHEVAQMIPEIILDLRT